MKKPHKILLVILTLLCTMLCTTGVALADTDGTELQVAQPMKLEIQLGPQWAGIEFQLKTDAGVYPGTVVVDADGVLRTELGGSANYTLSCVNSASDAPSPNDKLAPVPTEVQNDDGAHTNLVTLTPNSILEPEELSPIRESSMPINLESDGFEKTENTIGGIPVKHIILFGGGMLIAIGSLIVIRILRKRRAIDASEYDENDDDDYY